MILYRSGQIDLFFYILMVLFGEMKYIRLCVLEAGQKVRRMWVDTLAAPRRVQHIRLRTFEAVRKLKDRRLHTDHSGTT